MGGSSHVRAFRAREDVPHEPTTQSWSAHARGARTVASLRRESRSPAASSLALAIRALNVLTHNAGVAGSSPAPAIGEPIT